MSRLHSLRRTLGNAIALACEHHGGTDNAFSAICADLKRIKTELDATFPSFEHVRSQAVALANNIRSLINADIDAPDVLLLVKLEQHVNSLIGISARVQR